MRLTRFTDYSLRVLIYLGQNGGSRVTINQISEDYDISKNHLMKVVSNLTRLKFVVAQRGPGGGIQLNRAPEDICLKEVIRNTEKILPALHKNEARGKKERGPDDRLSGYLQHALSVYLEALGHFTLADVLESRETEGNLPELQVRAA